MTEQTTAAQPTRLAKLALEVHAVLNAALPENERPQLDHDEENLDKHGKKRRVIWLSRGGECVAPRQSGGRLNADGTERVTLCTTRDEDVEVHIFAESKAKTEKLLDALLAAIAEVLRIVNLGRYTWVTQEDGKAGYALRNQYVVLRFKLGLPVRSKIEPLGAFTGVVDECGLMEDDGTINV